MKPPTEVNPENKLLVGMDYDIEAYERFSEKAIAEARERGCVIMEAKSNQIAIDIDGPYQKTERASLLQVLDCLRNLHRNNFMPVDKYDLDFCYWRSESGKGFHVLVNWPFNLAPMQQILLEVVGGGDPSRAKHRLIALSEKGESRSLLFMPPTITVSYGKFRWITKTVAFDSNTKLNQVDKTAE